MSPEPEPKVYRLVVSYRGTRYCGWQRQANAPTVQQEVELALERLLGRPVRVVGCSRTDAGVHARGQVAHLVLSESFATKGLVHGGNRYLPEDVRILEAASMPGDFHSRKHAVAKIYSYRLSSAEVISPLDAPFVAPLDRRVDHERLRCAARLLIGHHDFSAFAKTGGSHTTPWRTLCAVEARTGGTNGELLELVFRGDGFLRGMVRALVGTLLEIGRGHRDELQLAELLKGGDRSQTGVAAPARGLVLEQVIYPPDWQPKSTQRANR